MTLKVFFLAQLEREAAHTRKATERVPEGHNVYLQLAFSAVPALYRPLADERF